MMGPLTFTELLTDSRLCTYKSVHRPTVCITTAWSLTIILSSLSPNQLFSGKVSLRELLTHTLWNSDNTEIRLLLFRLLLTTPLLVTLIPSRLAGGGYTGKHSDHLYTCPSDSGPHIAWVFYYRSYFGPLGTNLHYPLYLTVDWEKKIGLE